MKIIKYCLKLIAMILMVMFGFWIFKKATRVIILSVLGYLAFVIGTFAFIGYMIVSIFL